MMNRVVLYVPGLNDDRFPQKHLLRILPSIWKLFGFHLIVISMQWRKGTFQSKLKRITDMIDVTSRPGVSLYLIGQSAGGAAVLNAFVSRKQKIQKVINVCGRLRQGIHVFPSLEKAARGNPAFQESVLLFEQTNEKKLSQADSRKILTLRPIMDEVVPIATSSLKGATNIVLPMIEHSLTGMIAMTFLSHHIRKFLTE